MKRAQVFDLGMIFVLIGAMVGIMLVTNAVASETSPWKSAGQRAFELQNAYAEGEYFVTFMASGARWASWRAVETLGGQGGFLASPCGMVNGLQLWNKKDEYETLCIPSAYENFYALLGTELDGYIRLYAQSRAGEKSTVEGKEITVTAKPFTSPYAFLTAGNRLRGIATAPVFVNILTPVEGTKDYALLGLWTSERTHDPSVAGTYVFRPNFEIPFTYNLGVYQELAAAAQEMITECAVHDAAETRNCASKKIEAALAKAHEQETVSDITNDGDLFTFTLTQHGRKTLYTSNHAPVIRFGLYLPSVSAS